MASIVTGGPWEYWLSGLHHGRATKPNLITAAPQPFIPWAAFSVHKEPKDSHVQRRKVILSHVATCLDTKHTPVLILTHSYIHTLHNYICTAHRHMAIHSCTYLEAPETHILRPIKHIHTGMDVHSHMAMQWHIDSHG